MPQASHVWVTSGEVDGLIVEVGAKVLVGEGVGDEVAVGEDVLVGVGVGAAVGVGVGEGVGVGVGSGLDVKAYNVAALAIDITVALAGIVTFCIEVM